ncbi:MAG: hypothetical protein EXR75_01555 [Myxococcales bacterium]|nr:hypothetical protein [Myxococcales bacterium]
MTMTRTDLAAAPKGSLILPATLGRYQLFMEIARGGMATVYLARMLGKAGFERLVAVKVLHEHLASDAEFVKMFLDEARIAARIQHPNVVDVFDVDALNGSLIIVMSYVEGAALSRLVQAPRAGVEPLAIGFVLRVLHDALRGLHAAHGLRDGSGQLVNVIHRDVSPQNILVGADGVARVTDFGIAKAHGRLSETRHDVLKGKLRYLAPEQLTRAKLDRRADVFAAGAVLWEALVGRALLDGGSDAEIVGALLAGKFERPSKYRRDIPPALDAIVMRALERDVSLRYASAAELADAIDDAFGTEMYSARKVGSEVEAMASSTLATARRHARDSSQTPAARASGGWPTPADGNTLEQDLAEIREHLQDSGVHVRRSSPGERPTITPARPSATASETARANGSDDAHDSKFEAGSDDAYDANRATGSDDAYGADASGAPSDDDTVESANDGVFGAESDDRDDAAIDTVLAAEGDDADDAASRGARPAGASSRSLWLAAGVAAIAVLAGAFVLSGQGGPGEKEFAASVAKPPAAPETTPAAAHPGATAIAQRDLARADATAGSSAQPSGSATPASSAAADPAHAEEPASGSATAADSVATKAAMAAATTKAAATTTAAAVAVAVASAEARKTAPTGVAQPKGSRPPAGPPQPSAPPRKQFIPRGL